MTIRRIKNRPSEMPPVLGRIQNAVVLALITAGIALLLALSPVARMMEEELGLSWLFTLRGPLPPPRDVAIVSLDRQSARRLGLPPQVRLWPRSLRATLIGELKKRGATAIAFDLTLETPTDQIQDGALTRAISAARSVVLVESLEREEVAVTDAKGNPAGHMAIVKAVPPIEPFAKAAAALAPFPLPKIAARTNQFWAFKEGAGDRLTLPAAALQVHGASVHAIWLSRLREADVPGLETLPPDNDLLSEPGSIQRASLAVRHAFLQDPGLIERLPPLPARLGERERTLIDALDRLHTGPQHYYLNLYGPPGTITVIPFADLIEGKPIPDLTGSTVFVGVAERSSTNVDSFYTVFSTQDGIDISGVEIAATAFANLLDDVTLTMPKQGAVVGMLLGFGLAVGFVAYLLPGTWAVAATLFIAWAWVTVTFRMFEQHHLWLPLAVPMLVQVPIALFGGLLWQYLSANLERRNISRAIRYYLPEKAAADMTRWSGDPGSARDLVFGTCVASDAARFTALAESMAPRDLAILLDSYFATLFEQIQLHGGTVTDVVGDGIMSVWTAQQPERDLRVRAVMAALDMTAAVQRFNRLHPDKPMPTRFGLHAGWIMVGNVGGRGHFAWSVVGDIPNTASRLEGLNKHLGTSILASWEVVGDLETVLTRRLGRFRLLGKADALDIHEVVARRSEASASQLRLVATFETALEACEAGRIAEASDLLHRVLTEFPDDGPSRFYLERCAGHSAGTRILDDTAVVRLEAK
jgi:adenylate cyclase